MKKKYLIRFNTLSTGDHDRWRLIDDETEHLVSDIVILVPSRTSKDEMEDVGTKFHISCEGVLEIKDGIAEIK